jgi:hypothetical protein
MPAIHIEHDPSTGGWSVGTADRVFRTKGRPDCDTWWQWLRQQSPDEAELFRGDKARSEFGNVVAFIQGGCYCEGCAARRPLTYRQARTRYMDTGTIIDKEAMLACVTMTVPDLDTLGRAWEPAAPAPAAIPNPRITRERAGAGFTVSGFLLAVVSLIAGLMPAFPVVALVLLAAGLALRFWPMIRR